MQGVTPIFNAEGPDQSGRYSVVVGLVWSLSMSKVAESFYNSSVTLARKPPKPTIHDQISHMLSKDPNALAAFLGLRVWINEQGEHVLVSVVAEDRTASEIMVRKKAAMRARAQMARFISEAMVSDAVIQGGESLDYYPDASNKPFNESEFKMMIEARSRERTESECGI